MSASISICVPAYNAARTIDATIRSILDQDVDVEVLVLDNATRDGTADIVRSFHDPRLRAARNDEMLSIGDNWNKAVALSSGELVKIVCADDLLRPGSIEAQAKVMADPMIALTSARFDVIDETDEIRESDLGIPGLEGLHPPRDLIGTIVRRGPADFGPTAAAMFRREHFDRVGGLRGDLVFPMDVDLFARVVTFGMFFGMPERVAAWRDSTFNLCSRTSSFSKLTDMMRFHHRIAKDYPDLVSSGDVIAGDVRLARAALERLSVRSRELLAGLRD
ncbi:glycosyltransferase family 2 protein [Rhodococcus pyridinivorans]|uniref:glycosyltransferase family 2 protein n=1 Tax=Rhodococcus pyridinivorans TaxID=103816 RepID=UPI002078B3DB|nr:glycosyltransferase [Rhodococcus pyridinivorans]USI91355.1 glycosyltransferase [Rhodococcus pyridinivorans]